MIKLRFNFFIIFIILFFYGIEKIGIFNNEVVDTKKFENYYTTNQEDEGENILKENYFVLKRDYEEIEFDRKDGVVEDVVKFDYIVVEGDTIAEISEKFYVEKKVLEYNNPKLGKTLKIGEKISIPSENGVFYKIISGDNLGKISRAFGVKISEILRYNGFIINEKLKINESIFLINPDFKKIEELKRQIEVKRIRTLKRKKNNLKQEVEVYSSVQNFTMPIKYTGVTSAFGNRYHPILKRYIGHAGVDLKARYIPFRATKSGVIKFSGVQRGYGKIVIITHSNGYESRYAHLNSYKVKVGERVKQGQILGQTGNTGRSTGPHLHFEIRKNGRAINPLRALGKIK